MLISLDTEYSCKDVRKADLLSISIGTQTGEYLFREFRLTELNRLIASAKMIFTQNGAVDWYILRKNGIHLDREKFIDCMLMEHLIDENLDHDLGSMSLRYFNDNYKKEFWDKYDSFQESTEEDSVPYERKDARYTFDLGVKFLELLKDRLPLVEHVHKLYWTLFDTEIEGVRIDETLLKKTKEEMSEKIESFLPKLRSEFQDHCSTWELTKWRDEINKRISDKARSNVKRPVFSFSSDSQIRWLIYDSIGCEVKEKTKKGQPSTSYDTLKDLSATYPSLNTLVEYKGTKAVYSTFVEGLLERVEDGRVHPHFSVNGTTTGRLSSSNPNFQNMPQDGVIRNFILPDEGCQIVGADFEGLEVGVEANLTEDKQLLRIMLEGASKHDITAEGLGISRTQAKTLNFALQYGAGVHKISKILGISNSEAQTVFDRYWGIYSGVKLLKEKMSQTLKETGEVKNHFGRIRHFPKPATEFEKARFERQAYSHMIQGTGGEMTNIATYTIAKHFKDNKLGRFLFPVHDEIVCSSLLDKVEESKFAIVNIMESTNDILGFKYRIKAKSYGGFSCWRKA